MRPLLLVIAALAACVPENELTSKPTDRDLDTGPTGDTDAPDTDTDTDTAPPEEACNGLDDDGDGDVDEDFPDDDANGRVDCLDVTCPALDAGVAGDVAINEECDGGAVVEPVPDPWNVKVQWTFTRASDGSDQIISTPVVGNLDDDNGDGRIDEDDDPEIVVNMFDAWYTKSAIVVLDGATGVEKWRWSGANHGTGTAIADVDADGHPDVLGYAESGHAVALEGDGTLKWTSLLTAGNYALVSAADLDADGQPEVIADWLVLDGMTGRTEFQMDRGAALYTIAAVADADLDGLQEVYFAGRAYDSAGTELWNSGETGDLALWPVVVQADADPEAEIGFVGDQWSLWEHDGTNVFERRYNTTARPGPPCAGDFDGDGAAEVAWGSYEDFVMYELDGTRVWAADMDDTSGLAGCSGFDVDGDGALEILFADQSTFTIFDGATGTANYTNTSHASGTLAEYPSVADIDHDGHAEILVAANDFRGGAFDALTVFEHDGSGWPAAGSTWAIHDFAITNLLPDGSVPATPDPYWNRYNVYRSRVAVDVPPAEDLAVAITDVCVADCDYGPVQLSVQVRNEGAADVAAGAILTVYALDGGVSRVVATSTLPEVPAGRSLDGIAFDLTPADIGAEGFSATVDEAGALAECVEDNNTDAWIDTFCP